MAISGVARVARVSGRFREIEAADDGLRMKQSTSSMMHLVWNGPQAGEV
jgi:hypothetical protein